MTSSPGGWKAEEIAYQNKARLSRIGSDYSTRPSTSYASTSRSNSRPGFNRANSDSSLDFTSSSPGFSMPGRSTASSMRSAAISRNTSYQGLEKVMESDRDQEPVFAAALLANRSKASRSPRGSTRSSLGKSPLSSVGECLSISPDVSQANACPESSADSSPAESENSSPTGSSSKTIVIVTISPIAANHS